MKFSDLRNILNNFELLSVFRRKNKVELAWLSRVVKPEGRYQVLKSEFKMNIC